MKLYELTSSYQQVLEIAEQLDAEILTDTLDAIEDAIETKVENTAFVIKSLEGNISLIDDEIKRLQAMKQTQQNNVRSLKEYIQGAMEQVGMNRIQGKLIKIAIQNNPPSVRLAEDFNDGRYLIELAPNIDKRAILDDLKQGKEIQGAKIVQEKSLRIR